MINALRICQQRHDMAEPECDTKFIDTAEGSNWLAGQPARQPRPSPVGRQKVR